MRTFSPHYTIHLIHISRRPADDRDVRAMASPRDSIARNVLRGTLPVTIAAFGIVYFVSRRSLWVAGAVALLLFVASLVSNVRFFREVGRRKAQKYDRSAVEVIEVHASRVLDIEPIGDNAPAYVFFADGGKALLTVGQWLLEQRSFPALSFAVYRWSDTGRPIRIETQSGEIEAEPSPVHVPQLPRGVVPEVAVFDATPATLQEDLDRAFKVYDR